jgi:hypothetical protein
VSACYQDDCTASAEWQVGGPNDTDLLRDVCLTHLAAAMETVADEQGEPVLAFTLAPDRTIDSLGNATTNPS